MLRKQRILKAANEYGSANPAQHGKSYTASNPITRERMQVRRIHSLKLLPHNKPMFFICMGKSGVVRHLVMNQGKVMSGLPKLCYRFVSENIGSPKDASLR
jgi:hypothetical protein